MGYVEYRSNNSGGHWWVDDNGWKALEDGGWIVAWKKLHNHFDEKGDYVRDENGVPKLFVEPQNNSFSSIGMLDTKDGRWLGTLATTAYRNGLPLREAANEFERLTGCSPTDAGCACCGQPHIFTEYDDSGKYLRCGPETVYAAAWED